MSARPFPLGDLQSWMQAVLVHPGGVEAGLGSDEARRLLPPEETGSVVRARGELDGVARLGIYASMYPLRMVEALRSDYPGLAALLGEERFGSLVHDYVAAHPSRSFTLARLGDGLPEFVATWGALRHRGLRADVARLERAAGKVFDAEEPAPLDPGALGALSPEEWPSARLRTSGTFQLVRVRPGAVDVLDAFLEGRPLPERAGRGRIAVAFYRRDFVVLRRTLGRVDGCLLAAISAGEPLGSALEVTRRAFPTGFPSAEVLAGWAAEWTRLGFFSGLERTPARAERLLPSP